MPRDESDFHIRPVKVRDRAQRAPQVRHPARGFLADVHRAIRRAGGDPNRLAGKRKASGRFNARGRGAKAVDADLRYLERDGVTRDGEKGQAYSAGGDIAEGRDFLNRGRDDRHQFRFIVSAEEGVELTDLSQTTRDLMTQIEAICRRSSIGSRWITTTPATRIATSSPGASPMTARS